MKLDYIKNITVSEILISSKSNIPFSDPIIKFLMSMGLKIDEIGRWEGHFSLE